MDDLRELYQATILEHNKKPRNFGKLEACTHHADGHNPLCGDEIELTLVVQDGLVQDLKFQGHGCAISQASSSLMTTSVKGKPVAEVAKLRETVQHALTEHDFAVPPELGKLAALTGVREFPARVKCATLCWHTLEAALVPGATTVSTE